MDVTPVICVCSELSNPKVLTGTEESHSDAMDISNSIGAAHNCQLAPNIEARVGPNWSSNYS